MDIVTHCKVPRYLHNDLPLGNPLGKPFDTVAHYNSARTALTLAAETSMPSVTVSDLRWSDDDDWKAAYSRVDDDNREMLAAKGEENRRKRAFDNASGLKR
jgi:hypothetical protein